MPTLSPSASRHHNAFDQLARPIQKWIRKQGWDSLREVQERAIPAILNGGDVIISAATASGKTEAAFLPLISRSLASPEADGFQIVYISPLKALINDQYRRLEGLCADVQLALHKWHGDVSQTAKSRARRRPAGVLLITPESLEATLMRRGGEAPKLFGAVEAIIIDELHAFIGSERGVQLSSLLSRIELSANRRIDRIGLSATLGEMHLAAEALRPGLSDGTLRLIDSSADKNNAPIVQIETYVSSRSPDCNRDERAEADAACDRTIAEAIFEQFRGTPNLLFGNSRAVVERFSTLLREISEEQGVSNEFLPHHGKLSKELREFAENEIRDRRQTTTIVATSTLEMGVDIGAVECVAQIDAATSVAALRQRVGRSGRREGQRPKLRMFLRQREPIPNGSLQSHLHFGLVQGIAVSNLLLRGWCEPPVAAGMHLSTLAHQIMALIAQHAGRKAHLLFDDLCTIGPFRNVSAPMFLSLLRWMGETDRALIEQSADGTLLLGRKGERWTEHFTFYAVFPTPEEFRIVAEGVTLGTLEPTPEQMIAGNAIMFAGRRWNIAEVSIEAKMLRVVPSRRGDPAPANGVVSIHEVIGREMRAILLGANASVIDPTGDHILSIARQNFRASRLDVNPIQQSGSGFDLYPWTGTRELHALSILLNANGITARAEWPYLHVSNVSYNDLLASLVNLSSHPAPKAEDIVGRCAVPPLIEKFDFAVPPELRSLAYLKERVNLEAVPRLATELSCASEMVDPVE